MRVLFAVELVPPTRHLLRAKELADARYFEELAVEDLARAARLSPAHFSREFRRAFGETPLGDTPAAVADRKAQEDGDIVVLGPRV